ncbi:MAG: TonB-dependent receptor [Bacteroidota bacterium]
MKKIITLVLFLSFGIVSAQHDFSGKVVDAEKHPLPGVNVVVKGTDKGTTTDFDGLFSIEVADENSVLKFSMVGFETQEISGGKDILVTMIPKSSVLSEVVLVGSRNPRRTKLETPVPVDVVTVSDVKLEIPQTTINDMLTYLVPSFNSNRQSASDGTEHIDPASLRGLGPDQTLVLVNGKRRHTTSLVNNQQTVGHGSVGTDLSAIPSSAVERIEVLRDGASAQYGSDAIAGVINIVLKKTVGLEASATYGVTSEGDGETINVNLNYGTEIGNDGVLNLSAEFNDRKSTNRSGHHDLIIYDQSEWDNWFAYPFANDGAKEIDDQLIAEAGLTRDDFNFHVGDAAIKNAQFFYNLSLPTSENGEFYSSGGINIRKGTGYGFRRLPSEWHVLEIFPNGFQPELKSDILDLSLITGYKTMVGEWYFDISNTAGGNSFDYGVNNTVNDALGADSPTSFDAGGHAFFQNTMNLDVSKYNEEILNGLNTALGAEFRYEKYAIGAGEYGSYYEDGANSFPGFSPDNEVSESRTSVAAYADLELNVSESFMVGAAGRFENFSDFGSTLNGKLSSRLKLGDMFALRGSVSTGFRAPSLHQKYFNNITSDIVDGVMVNNGTFRNDSNVANQLGINELKEETSVNMSIGLTANISDNFNVTLDAYNIDIDDRIIYTGSLGNDVWGDPEENIQAIFESLGLNVQAARFFTNAVNTSTQGIDLVANYKWEFENSKIDFSLLYNYNETEVDDKLNNIPADFIGQEDVYFGAQEKSLIETNFPKNKAIFTIDYSGDKLGVMLRNTYWGEVTRDGSPWGVSQKHDGKIVTDLSASYKFTDQLSFVLGASNLFDVYPDEQVYENSYFKVFPYAPVQMGTTGAYYFGRITFKL